jgi:transcriptional regulator with XRE-family HTH domain
VIDQVKKKRGGRQPGVWDVASEEFRAWREGQKLSRLRLGKLLGVSQTSVQNWETGNAVPSKKYQEQIAKLMAEGVAAPGAVAVGGLEAAGRELGAALGRFVALAIGARP